MILPPDEAKTKLCPLMSKPLGVADVGSWLEKTYCMADDCMAWRWAKDRSPEEVEQRNSWMHGQAKPPAGYCGA